MAASYPSIRAARWIRVARIGDFGGCVSIPPDRGFPEYFGKPVQFMAHSAPFTLNVAAQPMPGHRALDILSSRNRHTQIPAGALEIAVGIP